MSAKLAVLGLVIEEPSPAHRLTAKLRQRLASAEFVDSNVYAALARLEREGYVCQRDPDGNVHTGATPQRGLAVAPVDGARVPAAGSYHATAAGVRHFEAWLLASSTAPPLRDELHMKIALCQPHNVPRLIELVYGQELVCLARVQELKKAFERLRPPGAPAPLVGRGSAAQRWPGLVMVLVRDAELSFWDARLTWLQGVRESLERMSAECAAAGGHSRDV